MNRIDAHNSSSMGGARDVVIGSGSRVWQSLDGSGGLDARRFVALHHDQVESFAFHPGDRVWIFAYAPNDHGNLQLFKRLRGAATDCEFIYISSSGCRANDVSHCYRYPRIKQRAAAAARQMLGARVLTLGLVYGQLEALPRGTNAATSLQELRQFLLEPEWRVNPGGEQPLLRTVTRPFSGMPESLCHRIYGVLLRACGPWPCLLRPLDLLLRALGVRWYGYVYLSNRLWTSTT